MTPGRILLVVVGSLVGLYGVYLLLIRNDLASVPEIALWFAVGVVLHDFVLVPIAMLVGVGMSRWLPLTLRTPAAIGLVVLGSVTLVAIPVLGRFGERPDNPTLLDRNYSVGWLVLVGLVALAVGVATLVRSRRSVGTDAA